MTDLELIQALRDKADAGVHGSVRRLLELAARRISELSGQPCRLLTQEELQRLPEGAVVWEELRDTVDSEMLEGITAMVAAGDGEWIGSSTIMTNIKIPDREYLRWWSAKPSEELRRATPWDRSNG